MILILTEPADTHADHVVEILKARGAEFVRFHTEDFPSRANLSIGYAPNGKMRSLLRAEDSTIDLTQIDSVWCRRPRPPVPHEEMQGVAREFVAEECFDFLRDAWNSLDCRWLPARPLIILRAQCKASQLRVAGELGLELPPTLVTNNPDEFLDFYQQHNGNIISKLAGFAIQKAAGNIFVRFTEFVARRDVGYATAIRYCPAILQAYVPKR